MSRTASPGGTVAIPDASDRTISLAGGQRIHGWTVDRWIEYFRQTPDATAPGGVAGAIVTHMDAPRRQPEEFRERIRQALAWHSVGVKFAGGAPSVQHTETLVAALRIAFPEDMRELS